MTALTKRLLHAAEAALLIATAVAAVLLGHGSEWQPAVLVVLLIVLALFGEQFSVELSEGTLSASTIAVVLAMGLLGPGPAAACAVAAATLNSASRRVELLDWLTNLTAAAVVPFVGGMLVRVASNELQLSHGSHSAQPIVLGLVVMGAYGLALALNFLLVGLLAWVDDGRSPRDQAREFLPLVPGELSAGALASLLVVAYHGAGLPALIAAVIVLLIFQHLTVALLRSEERAEQLQSRSRQLVGLQLGVLRTLVRALEMRDQSSGRHAAAVAAYATALGRDLGWDEQQLDVIRAAGLLHEIGKFTWPDRVLHATSIPAEDETIVRSHPQVGSILVGALDSYGPVAEAILYHHERIDGGGYPAGLIGTEIPLASRVLAVCSTYDTMTGEGGYRSPMTDAEAVEELRVSARNGQLDPELVELFIAMVEREGDAVRDAADFEGDLEFDRRVREMAEPEAASAIERAPVRFNSRWLSRRRAGARS